MIALCDLIWLPMQKGFCDSQASGLKALNLCVARVASTDIQLIVKSFMFLKQESGTGKWRERHNNSSALR